MPSLFDIGKSGLQSYRQSLAVTGQNIANVNTEGYKKRDAALEEISAAGGGVTEISDQTGLGVRVEEIRRAFDEFLLDKARQTSSIYERSRTFSKEVKDLENILLPGDSNLSSSIGNFFNSLQEVAAAPEDQAPRIVAVENGQNLASQFNSYSNRLDNLKKRLINQANDAITSVNLLTKQLSSINEDLLNSGLTSQASNAKLDQRDTLIDQLSKVSQISVNYGARGEATVRLGNSGSGPIILENNNFNAIGISLKDGRLQPHVGLSKVATNQIQGGIIGGLTDSYAIAENTHGEIDNLAILINREFNRVQTSGLNLDGQIGKSMFTVKSLSAIPNPTNRTTVGVELNFSDPEKILKEDYKLSYSKGSQQWNLTSPNSIKTYYGKNKIEADGFSVTIFGKPLDGDEFTLSPSNESEGIKFNLSRPQDIAAASKIIVSSSTSNLGTSTLEEIALIPQVDNTTIGNIESVLSNGLTPTTATEFSSDGGVTIIPAGTNIVNLSSYITQPQAKFGLSSTDVSSLTSLTITLANSSSVTVDLTGVNSLEEVADILNSARDVNGSATTFRSLGLYAAGGASTLSIASNDQNISLATASIGSTLNGTITNPSVSTASNLQVFTREGRHISGTALSSSEIATFLTKENGFDSSYEYRADYLNQNYRGIESKRSSTTGNHTISYGANGTAASAQRAASTIPSSHVTAAYTLTVTSSNAGSVDVSVPIESSAGYVANLININANNLGIKASAVTRLKIPAPTSDGTISFTLKSKEGTNSSVSISASVVTTDMTNLATAINNYTGRTGVTANLSTDKRSIIIENSDGDDIQLTSFTSPSSLTIKILKNDYSETGQSVALDSSSYKAGRFSGELFLESSISISTSNNGGGATVSSSQDALRDGYFSLNSSVTGETKTLKAKVFEGDFSASHPDGISASSSVLKYGLTIADTSIDGNGADYVASVDASQLTEVTPTLIAQKIAESLRSSSPSIKIKGNSIPSVPNDGSSFKIQHDGLTYTLTMNNGEVEISGGEQNKLSAYFEDKSSFIVDTSSFSSTSSITFTEHGLETGDSITYNAAEKVVVDTSNFSSTTNITSIAHGFTTGDPIVYKANGSLAISGLTSGTTYYAVVSDANTFALATSSTNANNGTTFAITGGSGGSNSDTFASPINGLTDGESYYVVKTDDHNFRIASTYALATASSPTVLTITGGSGGNANDNFDPGQNLFISAGKTISGSQFSFATDSVNDTNALSFGMEDSNIFTTITGTELTNPSASGTSAAANGAHVHLPIDGNISGYLQFYILENSKTINTTSISSSSTTLTSSSHGFKTGDKLLYTAAGTNLNGLTGGTSYYVKVVDANTFSLASTFANATANTPTLVSFGGSGGNASDTFKVNYAHVTHNDHSTTASAAGIDVTAELIQTGDNTSKLSIIKEADENAIKFTGYDNVGVTFGFKANMTQVNVIGDELKVTSIDSTGGESATTKLPTSQVNLSIASGGIDSLSGSNISLTNLPPEDLIVLISGSGSKKIAANYGETSPAIDSSEYKLVIDSTNSSKVEIFEADTLHSVGTRLIPESGIINVAGKSLKFTGENSISDSFTINNNTNGIGDNRNLMQMLALQEADIIGLNSGSFQDIFNATAAEIGTSVRSSELQEETALSSRDEALSLEDEVSGVSMDNEASNLIQFQQAYQANARILQTARELFDSLLSVIRA